MSRELAPSAQKRASQAYRSRLAGAGLKRFEVRAPAGDQALVQALTRKLAEGGETAARVRAEVARSVEADQNSRGGILRALRASPLVGADLDLTREWVSERDVEL